MTRAKPKLRTLRKLDGTFRVVKEDEKLDHDEETRAEVARLKDTLDWAESKVAMAITLDRMVPQQGFLSLVNLYKPLYTTLITGHSAVTYEQRNSLVQNFMQLPKAEWLFFCDDDVVMMPDTLAKLIEIVREDPAKKVVAGVYFKRFPPHTPLVYLYQWDYEEKCGEPFPEEGWIDHLDISGDYRPIVAHKVWREPKLMRVDGVGMGCTLIHKSVFERMPYPWYSFAEGTEDLYFCRRAQQRDVKIWCDLRVQCGHIEQVPISGQHFANFMMLNGKWKENVHGNGD